MKHRFRLAALSAVLCLTGSAQTPPNATCATALPIFDGVNPGAPDGADGFTYTNVGGAVPPGVVGPAVWFVYTATTSAFTTFATCTPAGFGEGTQLGGILVYDGCGGTQLATAWLATGCRPSGSSTSPSKTSCGAVLVAGNSYYVAVYSQASTAGTFYLSVAPEQTAPAETCTGALPTLVVPATTIDLTGMAPPSGGAPCAASSSVVSDGWLSLVPASSGVLSLRASTVRSNSVQFYENYVVAPALYDAAAGCGPASPLACGSGGHLQASVVAGHPYALQISCGNWSLGPERVLISAVVTPPAPGEDCSTAIPLSIGTNVVDLKRISSDGSSAATCTGAATGVDVWRTLQVAADCVVVRSWDSNSISGVEVYAGACAALAPVLCPSDFNHFVALAGVTYYFRINPVAYAYGLNTGTLTLSCAPLAPNDGCADAAPIGLGSTTYSVSGSSYNPAEVPASTPHCYVPAQGAFDVWYSFAAPTTGGYVLRISNLPSTHGIQVVDGCGGPLVDCLTTVPTVGGSYSYCSFVAVAGGTMLIRCSGNVQPDGSAPTNSFDIQPAPINDDVDGAIELFAGLNPLPPDGQDGATFSMVGASDDGNLPPYGSTGLCPFTLPAVAIPGARPDVWFKYTPDFTGFATVSLCPPDGFTAPPPADPRLYVYLGTPLPDHTNIVACSENACGLWPRGVFFAAAGQTYYVQVEEGSAYGQGTASFYVRAGHGATDEPVGASCGGGTAVLVATDPLVGATSFTAILTSSFAGAHVFVYGSADAGVPFSLAGPVSNCTVVLDVSTLFELAYAQVSPGSALYIPVGVPPIPPEFAGFSFLMQAVQLPSAASPPTSPPYALTNGLRMHVGY